MKKQTFLRITAMLLLICLTVTLSLTASAAYPTPKDSVYDETSTLS